MRQLVLIPSIAALALAGCGDSADDAATGDTLTTAEVAEIASNAIKPEPGLYRATMTVSEVDIPGAPQGALDMMKQAMEGHSHEYCMSQEDVEKGFEEMARQSQESDDCAFEKFDVDGGSIDAKMSCKSGDVGTVNMSLQGKATPTSSEMDMTMVGNMTGMGESTIRMTAKHEKIGECPT